MQSAADTIKQYLAELPPERQVPINNLRNAILSNLPKGFTETMSYGMIGYVVPHSIYPAGYHCDPKLPLPFMSVASQKNAISFYHMGLYADAALMKWFTDEYAKQVPTKLDMGKSCIRFKKSEQIPYNLIGELVTKMSVKRWVSCYENQFKSTLTK